MNATEEPNSHHRQHEINMICVSFRLTLFFDAKKFISTVTVLSVNVTVLSRGRAASEFAQQICE